MANLFTTSKEGYGRLSHYHIVYINDEVGIGYCSESVGGKSQKHTHEVLLTQTGWQLSPSEDHIHDIIPYTTKPTQDKQDEHEIVCETLELWKAAQDAERESKKKADESDEFYSGKHWDDQEKTNKNAESRAALTINRVQRNVNEMSGLQRQQRSDIIYTPVEDSDQVLADIATILAKRITSACNFWVEESQAALDQYIRGRGNFGIRVSFDKDLRGEIIIECVPDENVVYGPHRKIDASDAEYVCLDDWYSAGKLKQLFPEKADEIQQDYTWYDEQYNEYEPAHHPYLLGGKPVPMLIGETKLVDIARKEYRMIEVRRRIYTKVPVVAFADHDFYFNALGWAAKDLSAIKSIAGFAVIDRIIGKVRVTKIAGNVLLEDQNPSDLPDDHFYVIPLYANKRKDDYWGIIEIGKDPQKMLNKLYSVAVDVANRMATYFWWYTQESFIDDEQKRKFLQNSNTPGAAIQCADMNTKPVKEDSGSFPSDIVQLMNVCNDLLSVLMDVNVESAGANESASHLLHRQQSRLTGSEHLFDNLTLAKITIGRLILSLIQRHYDADRIYRILVDENTKEQVLLGGQPLEDYPLKVIEQLLADKDISKLDVEVTEAAYSPTIRMATFMVMQEMAQNGQYVPPDLLFELAPIPDRIKKRAFQTMQQESQGQAQGQAATQQMEENKSLIAQGVIPPSVEGRLQQEAQDIQSQQSQQFQGEEGVPPQAAPPL